MFGFMLLVGFGEGNWGCIGPLLNEVFPTTVRASALGIIYNVSRGVQFLAPVVIAFVAARSTFGAGIALAAPFAVLAGLSVWALPETKGVRLAKANHRSKKIYRSAAREEDRDFPPDLPSTRQRHLRRAVVASTIGTTIEWYDFFLYGSAAALVFPEAVFPGLGSVCRPDPVVLDVFRGFVARPLGAALFGHFGDRIGRKALLVIDHDPDGRRDHGRRARPSYAAIGVWSAVLLTLFRALQGLAVGGEWSGSMLIPSEWAPRTAAASSPALPKPARRSAMMVANLALSGMDGLTSDARIPGLGLACPVSREHPTGRRRSLHPHWHSGIAGVCEPEIKGKVARTPIKDVLRENWREVALTTLRPHRSTRPVLHLHDLHLDLWYRSRLSRPTLLNLLSIRSITSILMIPLAGYVSDRFGRKRVIATGLIGTGLWGFVYFEFLGMGTATMIFFAMLIDAWMQDLQTARRRRSSPKRFLHRVDIPVPVLAIILRRSRLADRARDRDLSLQRISIADCDRRVWLGDHDHQPGRVVVAERSRGTGSRVMGCSTDESPSSPARAKASAGR